MNEVSDAEIKWIPVPQMGVEVAETPITRAQWRRVMGPDTEPEKLWAEGAEDLPATHVNWFEATEFASKVGGRLPGSEEFRLLALAGREAMPEPLEDYAVFGQQQICPVRTKLPNDWGLYDMAGLVWEWCLTDEDLVALVRGGSWNISRGLVCAVCRYDLSPNDRYDDVGVRPVRGGSWDGSEGDVYAASHVDGHLLATDRAHSVGLRPLRGGSWFNYNYFLRSAYRIDYYPDNRYNTFGFRVVVEHKN